MAARRYREPSPFRVVDPQIGGVANAYRHSAARLGNFVNDVIRTKQEERRRAAAEAAAAQAQKDTAAGQLAGAELALQPIPKPGEGETLVPGKITGSPAYQRAAVAGYLAMASLDNDRMILELEAANQNNLAGFDAALAELRKSRLDGVPEQVGTYLQYDLLKGAGSARMRIQTGQIKAKMKEAGDALGLVTDTALSGAVSAARLGNDEAIEHSRSKYSAALGELESLGRINSVDREKALGGFEAEVTKGRILGEVERATEAGGPEAGQTVLDGVRRDAMPIDLYDKVMTEGAALISREKTQSARSSGTTSAGSRVASREAIMQGRAAIESMDFGIVPKDIDRVATGVAGTSMAEPLRESIENAPAMAEFVQLGPAGMDVALLAARAAAEADPGNAGRLRTVQRMERARDRYVAAMQDDPLGFAVSAGVVPDMGDPDITKPEDIRDRSRWAETASEYFKTDVPPFTRMQTQIIGDQIEQLPEATPQRQAIGIMLANIAPGLRAASLGMFNELGYRSITAAGEQMLDGSSKGEQVAQLVLEGGRLMADKDLSSRLMPTENDLTIAIEEWVGDAFEGSPDAYSHYAGAIKQAYVALSWREKKIGQLAVEPEILRRAAESVMGGRLIEGPRQDRRTESSVFPPPERDVTQRQFDDWLEGLTEADILEMGDLPGGYSADKVLELVKGGGGGRLVGVGQGEWTVEVETLADDYVRGEGRLRRDLERPSGDKWILRWTGGAGQRAKPRAVFQTVGELAGQAVPILPIPRQDLTDLGARVDTAVNEGF